MDDMKSAMDVVYLGGNLTTADGNPVPDGVYDMNLLLFTEPEGGTAVWSQWAESVKVSQGMFQAAVDRKTVPLEALGMGAAYLEVQVGKEAAQARQKVDLTAFNSNASPPSAPPVLSTDGVFSPVADLTPQPVSPPVRITPAAATVVGRLYVDSDTWGIGASDGYVYVSTLNRNFHVIDARDPTRPTIVSSLALPPSNAGLIQVVISGKYAYVLEAYTPGNHLDPNANKSGLTVIDVNEPTQPVVVSTWQTSTVAHRLAVSGNYAVLSVIEGGTLEIFALEKGIYPAHTGQMSLHRPFPDVALAGDYIYAVTGGYDFPGQFFTVDISKAGQPTLVSTVTLAPMALHLCVGNGYAYVTGTGNVGQVVDINNPAQPVVVGEWQVINIPSSIWLSGNTIYSIDEESDLLQVVDVSDPRHPVSYDFTFEAGGTHTYGVVANGYAYVISAATGLLQIIDLPM